MGRSQRSKGKRGELEAAKALAAVLKVEFGDDVRRSQQYSGEGASDVSCDVLPGVHLEVKRTEALRLWDAVEQAAADAGGDVPVVLHRSNRRPWLAIVPLDDLPRLAEQVFLTMAGRDAQ